MELKIPQLTQLTLFKIAQLARHGTVNTRSEHYSLRFKVSIPGRDNLFAEYIFALIQSWQNWKNDLFKENLE